MTTNHSLNISTLVAAAAVAILPAVASRAAYESSKYISSDVTISESTDASGTQIRLNPGASLTVEGEGTIYTIYSFVGTSSSADNGGDTTFNINEGATATILGTAVSSNSPGENASAGSFFLTNWPYTGTVNVAGTLNLNSGISNRDGTGVLNVNDGGVVNFIAGMTYADNKGAIKINVNDGGRINVGGSGIGNSSVATLTIDGGTIGILDRDSWSSAEPLHIGAGGATFDTEKYAMAADGNSASATGTAASMTFSGTISGSGELRVVGGGTLSLTGATTIGEISIADASTLSLTGAAAVDTVSVAGNTGTLLTSAAAQIGTISIAEDATLNLGGILNATTAIANSGTLALASDVAFNLAYSPDRSYSQAIVTGTVVVGEGGDWMSLTASNFAIEGQVMSADRAENFSLINGAVSFSTSKMDLTWAGNSGDYWNISEQKWTNAEGESHAFFHGDNVTFGAAGEQASSSPVVINLTDVETVRVGDVTVAGGSYEFNLASGSATISGDTLTIAAGASLQIGSSDSASLSANFESIKLGGTLVHDDNYEAWNSLEFTDAGANLYIYDMNGAGLAITNVVVSADATITSYYTKNLASTAVKIAKLSGSGNLDVTGSDNPRWAQTLYLEIGDITEYTGRLSIAQGQQGQKGPGHLTLTGDNAGYGNAAATIAVGNGGTLDLNGKSGTTFAVELAGGTLTSTATIAQSATQLPVITLTADSTVEATSGISFGVNAGTSNVESGVYLGGHTLSKTHSGTFFLIDTAVYNSVERNDDAAGAIHVDTGTLALGGTDASRAPISVASGATLSIVAGEKGNSTSEVGELTGAGTVSVSAGSTLNVSGNSTLTGALKISGVLTVGNGATLDLTGVTASQNGGTGEIAVSGEGCTVKMSSYAWGSASNFGSNMYNATLQIADGGTLEITEAQTGGAGDRAFSVTAGTGTYKYSGDETSYINNANNRNIHLGDDATLDFDVVNADAALSVAMEIAKGMANNDIAATAEISTGALQKTGAGTLVLTGNNLYSGGTTVSAGTLVAGGDNALGNGTVKVDGGTLEVSAGVTLANSVSVVIDSYVVATTIALAEADDVTATPTTAYAIVLGDGASLGDAATILVTASAEFLESLDEGETYEFAIVSGSYAGAFDYSELAQAGYAVSSDGGVITVTTVPEPSMFGIVAGLGAIGFVAARRRRRNRKA
ncbi:MAG: autotransporter-associated beta strand repeat-containing protein [Opitutae bacterium]|nr:autotransporter-associated beta strand repeat-containing protein [Opitutae bacterium]